MKTALFLSIGLVFPLFTHAQVHLGPGQTYPNIQAAASANAIQPGDTVYLHTGAYAGYQGITNLQGTDAAWIVIKPFQNDTVTIAGTWQFISCSYIRFQNLTFKGTPSHTGRLLSIDNGGSCETPSRFIVVEACWFSNTTDPNAVVAFKFSGVDGFEVLNNVFENFPVCGAMDYNVCKNGLIANNRFENCLTAGHIKGGASNITMTRNLFLNASAAPWVAYELGGDTGAQFYCEGNTFEVKNLKFHANIIVGGYRGLALASARDCEVTNNTFYNCGQATMRFLTTSVLYPELLGNKVENNLFAFGASAYFNGGTQPAGAVSFSNNIYYSTENAVFNGPYWDSPALDAIKDTNPLNYGSGTPMFVDGPNNIFNLAFGSPAIGNGKDVPEPSIDFYGLPFHETMRSIGAAESITVSVDEITTPALVVFPNPALDFIQVNGSPDVLAEIFNLAGVKVLEHRADQKIPVRGLPSGCYFIKMGGRMYPFIKL